MPIAKFILEHQLLIFIALGVMLFVGASSMLSTFWGAPWAPTSIKTIKRMLEMAEVQEGETLVDLGAGDGRIVIVAARLFKAEALGVEIDPLRCLVANVMIWLFGLRQRAQVRCGDMFKFDLTGTDVVTLYLLQGTNQRLKAKLTEQLRPGSRVVSRSFSLTGWAPAAIDEGHGLFLYEIGNIDPSVRTRIS
jgi:ribosomal protein L11 methylase PrmA